MEDNKYQIDPKKLKKMTESLKSLLEYYDKEDVLDVYIYNVIAATILGYNQKNLTEKQSLYLDSIIIYLILKANKYDEVQMKQKILAQVIAEITKTRISNILYKHLVTKMFLKNRENDIDYEKELYTTNEKDKIKLLEEKQEILRSQKYIDEQLATLYQKRQESVKENEEPTSEKRR